MNSPLLRRAQQTTATLLSFCLLWTSCNISQAASLAPHLLVGTPLPPQFNLVPPAQLGRVSDYYSAPSGGKKLVVLIQDLHAHYGVQKNIAGLLEFLTGRAGDGATGRPDDGATARLGDGATGRSGDQVAAQSLSRGLAPSDIPFALAVEGAQGPIDSSVLALFPDRDVRQTAADYLMRQGELTGVEEFGILRGLPNFPVGVENLQYYELHRDLFRKTLADREQLAGILKGIQSDLHSLRERTYSGDLKKFQKNLDRFEKADLTTDEFVQRLIIESRMLGLSWQKEFPELAHYVATLNADTAHPCSLSADQLRGYTSDFLKNAQQYLSSDERRTLIALAKQQNSTAYFLYLRDLVEKHQLFLAIPIELGRYLEYLHTTQTVGMDHITHEATDLAFQIKLRKTAPGPERDLVQVEHDLSLLINMANVQATQIDVQAFGPRLNQFVALCHALLESNGIRHFDEPKIRQLISSSIDYYAMALLRNKPMVDNTLALIGMGGRSTGRTGDGVTGRRGDGVTGRRGDGATGRHGDGVTGRTGEWANRRTGDVTATGSFAGSPIRTVAPSRARPVAPSPSLDIAVLVTGGFHTESMAQLLRQRNISYVVITPTVDQVTDADQALYLKRLSGHYLTVQDILSDRAGWSAAQERVAQTSKGTPPTALSQGYFTTGVILAAAALGAYAVLHGVAPDAHTLSQMAQAHLPVVVVSAITELKTFLQTSGALGSVAMAMAPKPPPPSFAEAQRRVISNDEEVPYLPREKRTLKVIKPATHGSLLNRFAEGLKKRFGFTSAIHPEAESAHDAANIPESKLVLISKDAVEKGKPWVSEWHEADHVVRFNQPSHLLDGWIEAEEGQTISPETTNLYSQGRWDEYAAHHQTVVSLDEIYTYARQARRLALMLRAEKNHETQASHFADLEETIAHGVIVSQRIDLYLGKLTSALVAGTATWEADPIIPGSIRIRMDGTSLVRRTESGWANLSPSDQQSALATWARTVQILANTAHLTFDDVQDAVTEDRNGQRITKSMGYQNAAFSQSEIEVLNVRTKALLNLVTPGTTAETLAGRTTSASSPLPLIDQGLERLFDNVERIHGVAVRRFVEKAEVPEATKEYLLRLLNKARFRFDLNLAHDLAAVVIDPAFSDGLIEKIEQFIGLAGIEDLIHRLAVGKIGNRFGAVGEILAADELVNGESLPYKTQLVRLGEAFPNGEGKQVAEFDGFIRLPNGRLAAVETKNGGLRGQDVEVVQKWLVEKKQQLGQKVANLRRLIRYQGELRAINGIDPAEIDDLVFVLKDVARNESERNLIRVELQRFVDRLNDVLGSKAPQGTEFRIKARVVFLPKVALFDPNGGGIIVSDKFRPISNITGQQFSNTVLAQRSKLLESLKKNRKDAHDAEAREIIALRSEIQNQLHARSAEAGLLIDFLLTEESGSPTQARHRFNEIFSSTKPDWLVATLRRIIDTVPAAQRLGALRRTLRGSPSESKNAGALGDGTPDVVMNHRDRGGRDVRGHHELHARGEFDHWLQELGREMGAPRLQDRPDWVDFRALVREKGVTGSDGVRRLITPYGEVRMERDGLLVIIDKRFGDNHVGRNEFAVFAQTSAKAQHEMTELRKWAAFAMRTDPSFGPEDIIAGRLGDWITQWAQRNAVAHPRWFRFLPKAFHLVARFNEWLFSFGIHVSRPLKKLTRMNASDTQFRLRSSNRTEEADHTTPDVVINSADEGDTFNAEKPLKLRMKLRVPEEDPAEKKLQELEALQEFKKRIAQPVQRGTGWLRIIATPQEAADFHNGWQSADQGNVRHMVKGDVAIIPVNIWQKMVAWVERSKDFERKGYFLYENLGHEIRFIDFVPLGSYAYDPAGGSAFDDLLTTQQPDSMFDIFFPSMEIASFFGVDLNVQQQLSYTHTAQGRPELKALPVHSHHLASKYPNGPSQQDRKIVNNLEFVYTLRTAQGVFYDKETTTALSTSEVLGNTAIVSSKDSQTSLNSRGRLGMTPDDPGTAGNGHSVTPKTHSDPMQRTFLRVAIAQLVQIAETNFISDEIFYGNYWPGVFDDAGVPYSPGRNEFIQTLQLAIKKSLPESLAFVDIDARATVLKIIDGLKSKFPGEPVFPKMGLTAKDKQQALVKKDLYRHLPSDLKVFIHRLRVSINIDQDPQELDVHQAPRDAVQLRITSNQLAEYSDALPQFMAVMAVRAHLRYWGVSDKSLDLLGLDIRPPNELKSFDYHETVHLMAIAEQVMPLFKSEETVAKLSQGYGLSVTDSRFESKNLAEWVSASHGVQRELSRAQLEARTHLPGDGKLLVAVRDRIEIVPTSKDVTMGKRGEKRYARAIAVGDAYIRKLERIGLTLNERALFEFLTSPEGQGVPSRWLLYKEGGSAGTAENPDIYFGKRLKLYKSGIDDGGWDIPDLRNTIDIMKHEISHAKDHRDNIPGYNWLASGTKVDHQRLYAEFRANLWAYDGDVALAAQATWMSYDLRGFIEKMGLQSASFETVYGVLKILSERIPVALEGASLEEGRKIASDLAAHPALPRRRISMTPSLESPTSGETNKPAALDKEPGTSRTRNAFLLIGAGTVLATWYVQPKAGLGLLGLGLKRLLHLGESGEVDVPQVETHLRYMVQAIDPGAALEFSVLPRGATDAQVTRRITESGERVYHVAISPHGGTDAVTYALAEELLHIRRMNAGDTETWKHWGTLGGWMARALDELFTIIGVARLPAAEVAALQKAVTAAAHGINAQGPATEGDLNGSMLDGFVNALKASPATDALRKTLHQERKDALSAPFRAAFQIAA